MNTKSETSTYEKKGISDIINIHKSANHSNRRQYHSIQRETEKHQTQHHTKYRREYKAEK